MRSSNPSLSEKTFEKYRQEPVSKPMTLGGTVNKTFIMLLLVVTSALVTWNLYLSQGYAGIVPLLVIGSLGGFIVALVTIFKNNLAPFTAPLYAVLEGLAIGGISASFEADYPGIAIQAVSLTFGVLFVLLIVYKTGLIKVTENFKLGVVAATGAIALIYLINLIMHLFGSSIPFLYDNGIVGIGISLVIVTVAALNLVLDFDFIEQGVKFQAPKYMEWYGAFGLTVTLVWLYLEMLRLLAKLRSRD